MDLLDIVHATYSSSSTKETYLFTNIDVDRRIKLWIGFGLIDLYLKNSQKLRLWIYACQTELPGQTSECIESNWQAHAILHV